LACNADVALRDEIFVQLVKQTTKTPDTNKQTKGWELL
jgi:hypothetical protein